MRKYHQGDVILEPITKIPEGAVFIRKNIIMFGEATGHAHTIEDSLVYEKNGILYARVEQEVPMRHEEHPETLPVIRHDYRIRIQKEYFPDGSRQVQD